MKFALSFFNFRRTALTGLLGAALTGGGCHTMPQPGAFEPRKGDEIVVAGKLVHTGTPVVLWMDPGGYDAYRVERRFVPYDQADYETSRPHLDAPRSPTRFR